MNAPVPTLPAILQFLESPLEGRPSPSRWGRPVAMDLTYRQIFDIAPVYAEGSVRCFVISNPELRGKWLAEDQAKWDRENA